MYKLYTTSIDKTTDYLLEDLTLKKATFIYSKDLSQMETGFSGWPSSFINSDDYTSLICEFSSFEELRQNYPELFV